MDRKDTFMKIRVSATEKERLRQLADLSSCNESELLRRLVQSARVVVVPSLIEVNSEASTVRQDKVAGLAL
jgi:hypothetical protein